MENLLKDLVLQQKFFIEDPHKHAEIAVLNERVDGYYSIVLPWTYNRVWSYDREKGRYDSYKYADEE